MSDQTIVNKVVLVRLSFGVLGNEKQVKEDITATDANKRLLRTNKKLLDSHELAAIHKADSQIKAFVKNYCLPYHPGLYLLPNGFKNLIYDRLVEYETKERPALVQTFLSAYPELCNKAKEAEIGLGQLYKATDYAPAEVVAEKFYFDYDFLTFAPPDMAELTEAAKLKFENRVSQVTDEITVLMRQTLLDLVDHLKTALEPNADGKPKRLFSSNVTNIQEFLKNFKDRNITGDKDLEKVANQLSGLIHPNFDIDVLKNDTDFKNTFHNKVSNISSELSNLVEVVPGRKFKTFNFDKEPENEDSIATG